MTLPGIHWREILSQDDVEAIHVLVVSSGVFSEEEVDVALELAEEALARKEASDYHFILAEHEGILLGYACFGRIPLTQGRFDLYWIVVDGNEQQKGIARMLLEQTEAAIKKADGRILYAETSSRAVYSPAQAFYRKTGFELVARIQDFYDDGDDKMIFAKVL
jgi:ribosomal protein S18 acetylase RimI-like enzyme